MVLGIIISVSLYITDSQTAEMQLLCQNTNVKKHSVSIDLIRVIAILGALFIHLTYPIYARPDFFGGTTWWLTTVISAFSRISIPLFIILSGYLLLPKYESWATTQGRLVHRLLVPFAFWFGFYLAWDSLFFHRTNSLLEIPILLYQSNTYHLYFLLILTGLYFLLPMLRLIFVHLENHYIKVLLNVGFVAGVLMYFVPYGLIRDQAQFNIFTAWVPYLGYFLFGGFLATKKPPAPKWLIWIVLASFFTTIALSAYAVGFRETTTAWLWRSHGVAFVDEYLSPQIIVFALSFFWLMVSLPTNFYLFKNVLVSRLLRQLAKASFGAYLIHVLVLNVLDFRFDLALDAYPGSLLQYFLIRSSLCLILSFGLSWLLLQIPWINKVFGEQ